MPAAVGAILLQRAFFISTEKKEDYLKNAILEYSKRLSKYCIFNIVELQDEKVPSNLSEAE